MNSVWNSPFAKRFGLTLSAFSALTVFLFMYAWVLSWTSSARLTDVGRGYFTVPESIVIYGGPILWIATLVYLINLANKGSAAARSNQIEHLPET